MGWFGIGEEVVNVIVFIVLLVCKFMIGMNVVIDGGIIKCV